MYCVVQYIFLCGLCVFVIFLCFCVFYVFVFILCFVCVGWGWGGVILQYMPTKYMT